MPTISMAASSIARGQPLLPSFSPAPRTEAHAGEVWAAGASARSVWMLEGVVIDDAQVFNDKLQEWEDLYNYHRPHGGLNGQTPLRATQAANPDPAVTAPRQLHTARPGFWRTPV